MHDECHYNKKTKRTPFQKAKDFIFKIFNPKPDFLSKQFNMSKAEICCAKNDVQITGQLYKDHQDPLYQLAYYDTLTGCYNRNMLEQMRTDLDDKELNVIFIDLDNFKRYNSAYGHIGGDRRLREIADKLLSAFDRVYRLGGDEFMVITYRCVSSIDRFLDDIEEISYGVYKKRANEFLSHAMHKADLLMYECKKRKNKMEVFR